MEPETPTPVPVTPQPLPPPPPPTTPPPFYQNKRFVIILTVLVVLLLLGGVSVLGVMKRQAPVPTPTPTKAPAPTKEVTPGPTAAAALSTPSATVTTSQIDAMHLSGSAQIKAGKIPGAGIPIEAIVNGKVCGLTNTSETSELLVNFSMDVKSATDEVGCGKPGDSVTFKIGGQTAMQTKPFASGTQPNIVLNVTY